MKAPPGVNAIRSFPVSRQAANLPSLLPEEWRVELPAFEGPLDLLLHLARVNEVEVADIPVAKICDQFHEYLSLMEELNLDIAAEYIYEAALLIHLKSRMLLPRTKKADGEPEEDPREELVQRLLEYQRLKEAAQSLAEVDSVRSGIWIRDAGRPDLPAADGEEEVDLGDVSLFDLLSAFKTVLVRYDLDHPPPFRMARETFSVRGQIERILSRLGGSRPYNLLDDLRTLSCRAEAISAFLAVLEMARMNLVRLHQTGSGEILLYRTTRELAVEELEAIGG